MKSHSVISKLEQTHVFLLHSKYKNLIHFNDAYLIVAKAFYNACQENFFMNAAGMEQLDRIFAEYYFRAVQQEELPPEWKDTFSSNTQKDSQLFSLLLGAHTHIRHDLPLALLETIHEPVEIEKDFIAAKKVFKKAIWEILITFDAESKKSLRGKVIYIATLWTIFRWRNDAWKSFIQLRDNRLTEADLLNRTLLHAKKIRWLEKVIVK